MFSSEMIVAGKDGKQYQLLVNSTGSRLWLNADDGSSVARFNTKSGVDVHNTASEQIEGAPECLWCTHEQPDYETWLGFVFAVKTHYGVTLRNEDINIELLKK